MAVATPTLRLRVGVNGGDVPGEFRILAALTIHR
jgi:hypothetical protein